MSFKMQNIVGAQMQNIVTERVHSLNARTNRAIGQVKGLAAKGKLNTPGVVRNHREIVTNQNALRRWEQIRERVEA